MSESVIMSEKSYIHKPATIPMYYRTLAQLYDYQTSLHPQSEAFVIYDSDRQRSVHTFQDVKDKSVETAALLLQIGIMRGQRVALMAPNCIEFVWCFLALNRIGANALLIPMYGKKEEEVKDTIERLKCEAFLVFPSADISYDQKLLKIVGRILDQGKIINIGPEGKSHCGFVKSFKGLLGTTSELNVSKVSKLQDKVQFDDPAVILLTSGSTGEPKAIQYTNHAVVNEAFALGKYWYGINIDDKKSILYNDRPFTYAACFLVGLNTVFALGSKLVTIPITAAANTVPTNFMLQVLQDEKCTHGFFLPSLIQDLISYHNADKYDLKNLKTITSGGQTIPQESFSRLQRILPNCSMTYIYAMSEIVPIAGRSFDGTAPDSYDSLVVNPSMEVKIVNDMKEVVPVGEKGEICVRSPFSFSGYLEDPKAKMRDIDPNGWIHTDDVGYIDHQAGLHVCGRIHEVINRDIDKIYPIEVEKVLSLHPDVKNVAVIGVPDKRLNEEICACVIPKAGSGLESSVTEFEDWASLQWKADDVGLTRKPRYTLVFQNFPATKTGKINRKALRSIAMEKLGLNQK